MTIPHMTMIPISDIRLMLLPNSHRTRIAPKISTTISERIMKGCTNDSNWAARMK